MCAFKRRWISCGIVRYDVNQYINIKYITSYDDIQIVSFVELYRIIIFWSHNALSLNSYMIQYRIYIPYIFASKVGATTAVKLNTHRILKGKNVEFFMKSQT